MTTICNMRQQQHLAKLFFFHFMCTVHVATYMHAIFNMQRSLIAIQPLGILAANTRNPISCCSTVVHCIAVGLDAKVSPSESVAAPK